MSQFNFYVARHSCQLPKFGGVADETDVKYLRFFASAPVDRWTGKTGPPPRDLHPLFLMPPSPSFRSVNQLSLFIVPGESRTQPPSEIPKAHPSNGRADEQSGTAGVQMETLMEMQESSKSEKGGGGGGRVVVVWGGVAWGGGVERQQLTSQGISQGWLIQCDQRKILIFK